MRKHSSCLVILLLVSILLTSLAGFAGDEPIRLGVERVQNGNWDYYIEKVIDDRSPEQVFANLWHRDGNGKYKSFPSEINGGSKLAISNFLLYGLPRNKEARPMQIRILDLNIRENNETKYVSGQISLKVQFELEKNWGTQALTSYAMKLNYTRSINNPESIELHLRKVLGNSLKYIYQWVKKESATNILLAKGLQVSFKNYEEEDTDTIYYHKDRALSFDDFRAKSPQNNKFQAAIFPSFGYDLHRELKEGFIQIQVILKVYMIRSASWASALIKSNYSLNHEQRHFDLVKLIAERFKSKLISEKLNPDNYEGIISFEYLQFYREMNRLQDKYDQETNHGMNKSKQDDWNRWIDAELNTPQTALNK